VPSEDVLRWLGDSGLQTRWAHRLQVYVPLARSSFGHSFDIRHSTFVIVAEDVCATASHDRIRRKSQMSPITNTARVCETCGSPIETTSAGDLGCIACLIGTGLDAEAEQSDTAFASAPDQLGAYTIEHHADGSVWELGHGAMGVTYRAIARSL
jgi:hypothetical protein